MRTNIYIDGFNFYYSSVMGSSFKWLDFNTLCKNILTDSHQIEQINYFTARVSGRFDSSQPQRQDTFIRAIQAHIPNLTIHFGTFLSHEVSAPLANPVPPRFKERIIKTEEKGSDVNLAVHMLNDAWKNSYDCAVLISNDSDFVEAVKLVKLLGKKVIILLHRKTKQSQMLCSHADAVLRYSDSQLAISQLPNPIPGTTIRKPANW